MCDFSDSLSLNSVFLDAIASVGLPISVCLYVHVLIDDGISTCEII